MAFLVCCYIVNILSFSIVYLGMTCIRVHIHNASYLVEGSAAARKEGIGL